MTTETAITETDLFDHEPTDPAAPTLADHYAARLEALEKENEALRQRVRDLEYALKDLETTTQYAVDRLERWSLSKP
jgi:hypothetical protein